jgi:hypothetical protein
MDKKFKRGDICQVNTRDFKNELAEVYSDRAGNFYLVKLIDIGLFCNIDAASMTKQHGVCVEQLTKKQGGM